MRELRAEVNATAAVFRGQGFRRVQEPYALNRMCFVHSRSRFINSSYRENSSESLSHSVGAGSKKQEVGSRKQEPNPQLFSFAAVLSLPLSAAAQLSLDVLGQLL